MKKYISHCGAEAASGKTGNVTAQEQLDMIQITPCSPQNIETDLFSLPSQSATLNCILGNTLVYIAGWVVKKLLEKLSCITCKLSLVDHECVKHENVKHEKYFTLIDIKNNGGLIYASDGVITIVGLVEQYLKSTPKPILLHCTKFVIEQVGCNDIFNLGPHVIESAIGIDNHSISMMRLTIQIFFDLRQHQRAKMHNLSLHKSCVRQKNTKAILFMGQ